MREMEGIVIRTTRYGESSVIAEILTAEEGSVTVIASGLRSRRGRAHAALLKTGTPVQVVLYFKPGGNMHRLKEAQAGYRLRSIPFSIVKSSLLLFIIDVARNAFRSFAEHDTAYRFLMDQIQQLDERNQKLSLVPIQFLMELSFYLGFGPEFDQKSPPAFFDLQQGVFSSSMPVHPNYFAEQDASLFWALGRHLQKGEPYPNEIDRITRQRLLDALILFFRLHIDQFKTPKSHEILSQLFHPGDKPSPQ